MTYLMNSKQFVDKIENIRKNYKTVYMLGTVGQKLTSMDLINGCARRLPNFYTSAKINQLKPYIGNSWAFDCVGLIKAVLWNWTPEKANYAINGVPDINETTMINNYCHDVSTNFNNIVAGEVVWLSGHIGVYIGDGLVVECTPKWTNNVQVTWLQNLGTNAKYNNRSWTKHGKLNWVDYSVSKQSIELQAKSKLLHTVSNDYLPNTFCRKFTVKVTADVLNVRSGAGTSFDQIKRYPVLTKGNTVNVYDSILDKNGDTWYYVYITDKKISGYVHSDWCKKM